MFPLKRNLNPGKKLLALWEFCNFKNSKFFVSLFYCISLFTLIIIIFVQNITENSDNKKGTWYCNECFISNASEAVRCAACNSDRTGKKSIKTLPNILANREFKPSAQINSGSFL